MSNSASHWQVKRKWDMQAPRGLPGRIYIGRCRYAVWGCRVVLIPLVSPFLPGSLSGSMCLLFIPPRHDSTASLISQIFLQAPMDPSKSFRLVSGLANGRYPNAAFSASLRSCMSKECILAIFSRRVRCSKKRKTLPLWVANAMSHIMDRGTFHGHRHQIHTVSWLSLDLQAAASATWSNKK